MVFALVLALGLTSTAGVFAQDVPDAELRQLLIDRVGSLDSLQVPDDDAELPQPSLPGGQVDPLYEITEAKRYLGKLLFHDPIMTTNIQSAFGGDPDTVQTASCSSCHLAEAATKAGAQTAIGIGGSGRMRPDVIGNVFARRIQNDTLTDVIPTGVFRYMPEGELELSGSLDPVDSPPRAAPTVIGFAYNNRLTWDGAAGEPITTLDGDGNPLNSEELPAGENFVQFALGNHRMFGSWDASIRHNDVYRELFKRAFPGEYALYETTTNVGDFINEGTVRRALSGFLRTVISRDTPWDRFLAGDPSALDAQQRRGARLFAATTEDGGADCIACHSGPNLNKQLGDEEGVLVEENFVNIGIDEHPLQDLARSALGDPSHADRGRMNVTGNPAHAFAIKTPTVRQSRDAGPFMHDGSLETVRDVVEYFNAGIAADADAGAAESLSNRFTEPRGPGQTGLGLSAAEVDDLVDFLDSALYDAGLMWPVAGSPTRSFNIEYGELDYDQDLLDLGAQTGYLPSGLTVGDNDPQSIQDTYFVRGNVNPDDTVDISDVITVFYYLFIPGASEPVNFFAADMNDDSLIDLTDPIYVLEFLWLGGPPPPEPYPGVGQDWTR
jgi:cytochrome c peroxidase